MGRTADHPLSTISHCHSHTHNTRLVVVDRGVVIQTVTERVMKRRQQTLCKRVIPAWFALSLSLSLIGSHLLEVGMRTQQNQQKNTHE